MNPFHRHDWRIGTPRATTSDERRNGFEAGRISFGPNVAAFRLDGCATCPAASVTWWEGDGDARLAYATNQPEPEQQPRRRTTRVDRALV